MRIFALAALLCLPASARAAQGLVGLAADWHKGELVVVSVREGSPAEVAGLRHGDRILSIAGKPPKGAADVDRLRGAVGTEVEVVARARGQASNPRTVTLFREELSPNARDADHTEELEAGAAAGDAVSLTYYALQLMNGLNGRKKDPRAAVDHLTRAADAGFSKARYHLASALFAGKGRPADPKAALALAHAAVKQGLPEAMRLVGTAYSNGWGVAKDEIEAGIWIRKASDAGDKTAMCALTERLNAGRGMPEDPEEALYWAKSAVPESCGHYNFAVLLRDGRGTAADPVKAYEHAARAAHAGHPKASLLAGKLEGMMAKEDLDSLQAALREEGILPPRGGPSGDASSDADGGGAEAAQPPPGAAPQTPAAAMPGARP